MAPMFDGAIPWNLGDLSGCDVQCDEYQLYFEVQRNLIASSLYSLIDQMFSQQLRIRFDFTGVEDQRQLRESPRSFKF
jgi:hypothetical protein